CRELHRLVARAADLDAAQPSGAGELLCRRRDVVGQVLEVGRGLFAPHSLDVRVVRGLELAVDADAAVLDRACGDAGCAVGVRGALGRVALARESVAGGARDLGYRGERAPLAELES